ncbi:MAG: hypothetical protein AAGA11_16590 [Pseudomonadota bacterium]
MSTHFGISWIYEEFHAVRLSQDEVVQEWRASTPVTDLTGFSLALAEASKALRMRRGGEIAIAHESDEHTHSFFDVPSMSERDLEKYLVRQVAQEKGFSEAAAWAYRKSSADAENKSVLVHVMPASTRDAILRICEENHVVPRRLLPLTDIMAQHVLRVDRDHHEHTLLVALFDSRIEMVVLSADGDPMFVRELGFSWHGGGVERLRTDIERTLLFTKQRYQSTISAVTLMGVDAVEAATLMQPHFDITLSPDELSLEHGFWAAEINRLPKRTKTNFVPRSMQRAVTNRQLIATGKRMALAASLCSIAAIASIEFYIFQHAKQNADLISQIEQLRTEQSDLLAQRETLTTLEQQLATLTDPEHVLPVLFLQQIGDVLPESMVLRRIELEQRDTVWAFRLAGINYTSLADAAHSLSELESRLARAPWHAAVSASWQDAWLEQLRNGRAAGDAEISFEVEGDIL